MAFVAARNGYSLRFPDVSPFDFRTPLSAQRTEGQHRIDFGYKTYEVASGFGFTYNSDGDPVSGTVTSYIAVDAGRTILEMSGFFVPVEDVVAATLSYSTVDDAALLADLLQGQDVVFGSSNDDILKGYGGYDTIRGGAGNDDIDGGSGNDFLLGAAGEDYISGGSGNDRIVGGADTDQMKGGTGKDRFVFERLSDFGGLFDAADVIQDFRRGYDKIDLSKIDARQDGTAGNQAFTFIGSAEFSRKAGELRFSDGYVSGDTNGDGWEDLAILVLGRSYLTASDFAL
ncbi:MAG TPA: M10 family metallopeptidase C-terminal domain-containing protein [Microvirga sp.]|jgi:Ca2+-binding RTX toxin-like protein